MGLRAGFASVLPKNLFTCTGFPTGVAAAAFVVECRGCGHYGLISSDPVSSARTVVHLEGCVNGLVLEVVLSERSRSSSSEAAEG